MKAPHNFECQGYKGFCIQQHDQASLVFRVLNPHAIHLYILIGHQPKFLFGFQHYAH